MSARNDNPAIHRIAVERNEDGEVEYARFVCDGNDDSACHHWPDCGCETWGEGHHYDADDKPLPGHEDVQQSHCWMEPWFNDTTTTWSDLTDLYDGPLATDDPEVYGENADWFVSGPVSCTFEGDYMTWEYA